MAFYWRALVHISGNQLETTLEENEMAGACSVELLWSSVDSY